MTDKEALLNEKYNGNESPSFYADLAQLEAGEPLAYIIGNVPFLGNKISVNKDVLIPRPETEFWTEHAISEIKKIKKDAISVLDIFCGSGCVGVAVLNAIPNATVTFADIDNKCLSVAEQNCKENGISLSRVQFIKSDVFENIDSVYDVILANPPYIPAGRELEKSVTEFEPHKALFSGADGMESLMDTLKNIHRYLAENGFAYIEHDAQQTETLRKIATSYPHLNLSFQKDQYGRNRYIIVRHS